MGKVEEAAAMSLAQWVRAKAVFLECGTPLPPSPSGPVPIPYPNMYQNSPGNPGGQTVGVGGKVIVLKGKSDFKSSTGDEAATKHRMFQYMALGISRQGATELVQGLPISSMSDRLRIVSMQRRTD